MWRPKQEESSPFSSIRRGCRRCDDSSNGMCSEGTQTLLGAVHRLHQSSCRGSSLGRDREKALLSDRRHPTPELHDSGSQRRRMEGSRHNRISTSGVATLLLAVVLSRLDSLEAPSSCVVLVLVALLEAQESRGLATHELHLASAKPDAADCQHVASDRRLDISLRRDMRSPGECSAA